MHTTSYQEWFRRRVEIADSIVTNLYHLGLYDAEILLSCAISGLAAVIWPGRDIDRARFVEFLIRFSRVEPPMTLISIPRLVAYRREAADLATAEQLKRAFYPASNALVVTYRDIDRTEEGVSQVVPGVQRDEIRRASYASVIYRDLRSALVHEFQLSEHLSDSPMTMQQDVPSYWNELEGATGATDRLLYLPYGYVREVVSTSADAAFEMWQGADSWEQPKPPKWWVEG